MDLVPVPPIQTPPTIADMTLIGRNQHQTKKIFSDSGVKGGRSITGCVNPVLTHERVRTLLQGSWLRVGCKVSSTDWVKLTRRATSPAFAVRVDKFQYIVLGLWVSPYSYRREVVANVAIESEVKMFRKCGCLDWMSILIMSGYFPTSTKHPETAISLEILNFISFVSTNGSFSKQGFAKGLEEFHRYMLVQKVRSYLDAFRTCIPFFYRTRKVKDDFVRSILAKRAKEKYDLDKDGMEVDSEDGTSITVPPKPLSFKLGSLEEQCPSCFYRPYLDNSPVIVCIDGNFQHRRLKNVAKTSFHQYERQMFVDVPAEMVATVNTAPPIKEESLCANHFTATSKPQSMKCYDETGLLAMVCRYVHLPDHLV